MEEVETLLNLLRSREATAWVADQMLRTFSQGLSMSGKEASSDAVLMEFAPAGLTAREKQKRETYETTRPYTDGEKFLLIREALKRLYVELPAIQAAALGEAERAGATAVEFVTPEEADQTQSPYRIGLSEVQSRRQHLATAYKEFEDLISS